MKMMFLATGASPSLGHTRTNRGRPEDVSCRVSCRSRVSLGHVLKVCPGSCQVTRQYSAVRRHAPQPTQVERPLEPHYNVQENSVLLTKKKFKLALPFFTKRRQVAAHDVAVSRRLAKLWIHVTRSIHRVERLIRQIVFPDTRACASVIPSKGDFCPML